MTLPVKGIYRFSVFEANVATGELRKSGMRVRLQDQPFAVLVVLLNRAGELVTREELRQQLWPADTFVDFDHSLNTAINKLRETLGDSATSPRFVETVARRGYRFIAPVQVVEESRGENQQKIQTANTAPPAESGLQLLTHPDDVPRVTRPLLRVLFALLQAMYLSFYVIALAKIEHLPQALGGMLADARWVQAVLVLTAVIGIPIRLYLLSAIVFDVRTLGQKFGRIFPFVFVLDELWALSPFLLAPRIGLALALGFTAMLVYAPFSERTLLLMSDRSTAAQ
jgi:DNA-binding winged helix-turn-helix (wHTH) protein